MISFRFAAILLSGICTLVFIALLLAPSSYMGLYGVTADASGVFMGQRASPLMLGIAVLLWCARDLRLTPGREAIRLCIIVTFAGIAVTGVAAFMMGTAQWPILIASIGELLIAAIFLWGIRD